MPFKFERLQSSEDLALFQAEAAGQVQVTLPYSYLNAGTVVALTSVENGKKVIHGGFVISDSSLRSVMQIPAEKKSLFGKDILRKINSSFEVNGLWINSKTVPGAIAIAVWMALAYEMFLMVFRGKYYFVYSYDCDKYHLAKLYSSWSPSCVYAGPVNMLEGMKSPGEEVVECCSLKNVLVAIFTKPHFFMKRIFRPIRA